MKLLFGLPYKWDKLRRYCKTSLTVASWQLAHLTTLWFSLPRIKINWLQTRHITVGSPSTPGGGPDGGRPDDGRPGGSIPDGGGPEGAEL